MSPEKTKLLVEKFPVIFSRIASPDENDRTPLAMFYIECDDGWFDLIDHLCEKIQRRVEWKKIEPFVCAQVKEKFGTLRFYGNGGDDVTDAYISFAESFSGRICETCGSPGKVRGSGWFYTSCDEHARDNQ